MHPRNPDDLDDALKLTPLEREERPVHDLPSLLTPEYKAFTANCDLIVEKTGLTEAEVWRLIASHNVGYHIFNEVASKAFNSSFSSHDEARKRFHEILSQFPELPRHLLPTWAPLEPMTLNRLSLLAKAPATAPVTATTTSTVPAAQIKNRC